MTLLIITAFVVSIFFSIFNVIIIIVVFIRDFFFRKCTLFHVAGFCGRFVFVDGVEYKQRILKLDVVTEVCDGESGGGVGLYDEVERELIDEGGNGVVGA